MKFFQHLDTASYDEDTTVALCGTTKTERYHVWVNSKTGKPTDNVLYANPLNNDSGIKTRKLRQDAQANVHIVAELLEAAPVLIARAKAEADVAQEILHESRAAIAEAEGRQ